MRFGLKLLVGLMAWTISSNAWCETVTWIDPGQVDLSTGEPLLLQFHVPGLQSGTNVRLKAEHGRIQAQSVRENGLLVAEYQPTTSTERTNDVIEVRIRSLGLLETVPIDISPQNHGPEAVQFEPSWLEARPNEPITAQVRISKTHDHAPNLHASMGELGKPQEVENDWVWTWTHASAPDSSAVVSFILSDSIRPNSVQAVGVLPLHIQQSMTLNGPPGFSCALAQGDYRSEGVKVTPAGTVAMSVAINPTETTATIECTNPLGQIRDYPIEMTLADVPLFVMGEIPPLPAGSEFPASVTLFTVHPDGSPQTTTAPDLNGTGISIGELTPGPLPGTWRGLIQPDSNEQSWTISAGLDNHNQEQRGQTIPVTPTMHVSANPPAFGPDQNTTTIQIDLQSNIENYTQGLPVVETQNGTPKSSLKANGSGASIQVRLDKGNPGVWVLSSPPPNETGLPAAKVLAWAPNSTLLADGKTMRPIAIVTTDAMGHGVGQVQVELSVESTNSATLSADTLKTGRNGVAWAWITAGDSHGPLTVHASIANDHTTAPLLILPTDGAICASNPSACESHAYVVDGDQARRVLEATWRERVQLSWIPYQEPAMALAENSNEAGPTASSNMLTPTASQNTQMGTSQPDPITNPSPTLQTETNEVLPTPLPRARFSAGLASLSHVYESKSPLGAAAPTPVNHQKGNLLEGNPIGTIAGTGHIRIQIQQYSMDAGWLGSRVFLGQDEEITPTQFHSGWLDLRRNHQPHTAWNLYYGAGAAYQVFHVLLYDTNQPGEVMVNSMPTPGARLTAGAQWAHNQTQVELELSETFVPWPVRSTALLRLHRQVHPNLYGSIGIEFHARTARFAAGTDEILLTDQLQVLSFGITKAIP